MLPDNQDHSADKTVPEAPIDPAQSGNKIWLKALMILAGVVLLLFISKSVIKKAEPNAHPTASQSSQTQAVVSLTKTGFTPSTIRIKAGTTVTWTNADSTPHQVAADPYPQDDSIPDFDSTITLAQHDTVSFHFTTSGTYNFHDEKNPVKFKATIVVY